ncbi:MAG TPA: hypothetical protein VFB30_15440, partial [Spirochaetia bacterium]|nr:hypothetical protein [Spirochaetia bacterium]
MCDTFAALGPATRSGAVLFAKSADCEVNEAEPVVTQPAPAPPPPQPELPAMKLSSDAPAGKVTFDDQP